jgi:Holliday junction resolvase RusA-like endonuclease
VITLHLPAPLSVNRTRKIDWAAHKKTKEWLRQADASFLLQKRALAGRAITGPFELTLTLREGSKTDLDNCCKLAIDTVRRFRLVTDDDPTHMRRLVVEFGNVQGCRVTIKALP